MSRDVFVSHASEDHALAEQVCALLEQRGLKCWIAPRDVGAGSEWDEAILDAIERCRAYLLILSAHANRSSFVKNELNRAFSVKKPIVTFRIEEVLPGRSLELYLARHHWTDAFPPPLEPRVDQLASSLTRLLNPSADGSVEAPVVAAPKPKRASLSTPAQLASALRTWMMVAAIAMVVAAALAIPALRHLRETPLPPPPETRVDIVTPATNQPMHFALSPDGRQIVFVASGDGVLRLWLRSLATTTAQPLADTDGATFPFWSPDSRSIGFFAGGALKRLDLGSGAVRSLAPAVTGSGGTWGAKGDIVFAPSQTTPMLRVAATGGAATVVTTLGPQQSGHVMPFFLPDGNRFLFAVFGTPDTQGVYLGSLDGGAPIRLTHDSVRAMYLPAGSANTSGGGWLLWVRAGALVAQRLNLANAALIGDSVTLATGVRMDGRSWTGAMSVAATGLVAYRTGGTGLRQLTWFDRSGTAQGTLGEPDTSYRNPRVSPDGRRVVVARTEQGSNTDLWLLDGARVSRLTFDEAMDTHPVWSPDGMRIAFRSVRSGGGGLYQKLANGAGGEERLIVSDQDMAPSSWTRDGRFLLYLSNDPQTNADLWTVPIGGDHTPSLFLKTPFREAYGEFSPDGRWVAYHSNESGRNEIYVGSFVAPGTAEKAADGQWQVSTGGGITPKWRPDGKALYYVDSAGDMMEALITVTGTTLAPGTTGRLFSTRIVGLGVDTQVGWQYDVAPDGRFLINTELDSSTAAQITLIQNWNPEATAN